MVRQPIDLNTANEEELFDIKGIGEKRANEIVKYRNRNGMFKDWDDLNNIPGLPKNAIRNIKRRARIH
jgi:competence protein ComEA